MHHQTALNFTVHPTMELIYTTWTPLNYQYFYFYVHIHLQKPITTTLFELHCEVLCDRWLARVPVVCHARYSALQGMSSTYILMGTRGWISLHRSEGMLEEVLQTRRRSPLVLGSWKSQPGEAFHRHNLVSLRSPGCIKNHPKVHKSYAESYTWFRCTQKLQHKLFSSMCPTAGHFVSLSRSSDEFIWNQSFIVNLEYRYVQFKYLTTWNDMLQRFFNKTDLF